jgi:hypothetical protein
VIWITQALTLYVINLEEVLKVDFLSWFFPTITNPFPPFLLLAPQCQPLSIQACRSTTREHCALLSCLVWLHIHCLFDRMGAMLLGVIISAILHGVCLLQAFLYFMSRDPFRYINVDAWSDFGVTEYKQDSLLLKSLVSLWMHILLRLIFDPLG